MVDIRRAAIYVRVSTPLQSPENQLRELRPVAERSGWDIIDEYSDCASGAKSGKDRPEFERLQKDAAKRKFNVVLVWSIDRLGRKLKDLIEFLAHINSLGIDLFVLQQALDSTTPGGKAMFNMLAVLAEDERGLIRERVLAGLARAKAQGRVLGRPRIPNQVADAIRASLANGGASLRQIAFQHRVGLGSVQRIKAALQVATD